ncbi:uncharacterized protein K489DRAFT_380278 [Dissoconium aciculare CBS 342.82]|uniref:Uncharacterized protein n=1 Tax=Dissoconium aciculare CBS 342.82 TaxID=1314786 RepID=A0A6J3M5T2_9PEZI|nr:uncharacterized protein K489DRAFT_380278 [Dissoconium aciculare CBS 342.82]KAF1822889.1 hypothetical protein K489DRAFT_380278 [Dissoconium aciculare CBS 342.82]
MSPRSDAYCDGRNNICLVSVFSDSVASLDAVWIRLAQLLDSQCMHTGSRDAMCAMQQSCRGALARQM